MAQTNLPFQIKARQLEILAGRLDSSNWPSVVLACVFTYFFWGSASHAILLSWLAFQVIPALGKALFFYPWYYKTQINEHNVDQWLNAFNFSMLVSGLTWGVGMALFLELDDSLSVLFLMFTYCVILLSATLNLTSRMSTFYCFCVPFIVSLCLTYLTQVETLQVEPVVVFVLFLVINIRFAIVAHRDIMNLISVQFEKEKLADELEESVAEKNRFLAAASHDLRQPLHASGLLLSALGGHVSSKDGQQILQDISLSMNALSTSFNSLLDVSKLDAGVVEINLQDIPLDNLLSSITNEFAVQAGEKEIALTFISTELAVHTDVALLERVLRNLMSNAVTYTEQGTIEVSSSVLDDKRIEVVIKDSGIGIPPTEIERIFSEYYQVDNPERDRNKGFGLGLAIVKRLCDLLGIKIDVASELNVGTTFRLVLPAGDMTKVAAAKPHNTEPGDLSGITLLVIDDDLGVLNSMDRLLRNWGCEVLCAESAEQAIEMLVNTGVMPNMILADYRLRDNKTGVQACEDIFDEFNIEVPVVIITGDTSPDRIKSVVASGHQILHKPVAPAELRAFVQYQLGRELN